MAFYTLQSLKGIYRRHVSIGGQFGSWLTCHQNFEVHTAFIVWSKRQWIWGRPGSSESWNCLTCLNRVLFEPWPSVFSFAPSSWQAPLLFLLTRGPKTLFWKIQRTTYLWRGAAWMSSYVPLDMCKCYTQWDLITFHGSSVRINLQKFPSKIHLSCVPGAKDTLCQLNLVISCMCVL